MNNNTGYKTKPSISLDSNNINICGDLNAFYARFDSEQYSPSLHDLNNTLASLDSDNTHI